MREEDMDPVWVLPIFLQPGRVDLLVRSQQDEGVTNQILVGGRASVPLKRYQLPEDAEFEVFH